MKKGRSFELLVKNLEQILSNNPDISIESPKRLIDRTTGRLREHDIVITRKDKHRTTIIAIECRERSRPVGKPQLEAFEQKCKDTNVNVRVMVSNTGFTSTALEAAKHYGIDCLSISELYHLDWLNIRSITLTHQCMDSFNIVFILDKQTQKEIKKFVIQDVECEEISIESIKNSIENHVASNKQYIDNLTQNENLIKIDFPCDNLFLKDIDTHDVIKIRYIRAELGFTISSSKIPLSLFKYDNDRINTNILTGAVADISAGSVEGKMYFTMMDNGGELALIMRDECDEITFIPKILE